VVSLFIAINDRSWFDLLSRERLNKVNFWQPSGTSNLPGLLLPRRPDRDDVDRRDLGEATRADCGGAACVVTREEGRCAEAMTVERLHGRNAASHAAARVADLAAAGEAEAVDRWRAITSRIEALLGGRGGAPC
jgi:hypothetical protein